MKCLALMFVMLTACGGDDGEGNPTPDAADGRADAPSQTLKRDTSGWS